MQSVQHITRPQQGEDGTNPACPDVGKAQFNIELCVMLYKLQHDQGRYFLHEHPASASSWKEASMVELMNTHGVERVVADMCCFGMVSHDEQGTGLVKKPTGCLTNAECISRELSQRCVGGHRHVHLIGGKASAAEVYPYDLCCAILVGLKKQLTLSGRLKSGEPLLQLCREINNVKGWDEVEHAGEN